LTAGLLATDPVAMGPYRLLGRLGGGGMGQVFLAKSPGGRLVAVKVIRPDLAADPEFRARFGREVAAARRVSGMFTAVLVDAETNGPVPWLATAYIPGPSLSAAVRDSGPLPLASLLPLAAGLAEALSAIHAAGLVHRDLKPSNVVLAPDGPRVIDFGIAYAAEASALTETGAIMGSPGYMSPEQAQGQPVGPASDVFSLGTVIAFAASGAAPFGSGPAAALVYRVVNAQPDLASVPAELRPLVERCLAKDPAARPPLSELLAAFGGDLIPENWLPQAIASTLGSYAPSARMATLSAVSAPPAETIAPLPAETIAPLAAGTVAPEPGRAGETAPPAATGTTPPQAFLAVAPWDLAPPAETGWTPEAPAAAAAAPAGPARLDRAIPAGEPSGTGRRRRRLTVAGAAIVAVGIVVGLAVWLAPGDGTAGNRAGGPAPSLVAGSGATTQPPSATANATSGTAGRHGSKSPSAKPGKPTPASDGPTPSDGRTPGTVVSTAPGSTVSSAPASHTATTSAPASPTAHATSAGPTPTSSAPTTSSNGVLTATNGVIYSCSNYPVSSGSSDKVSYNWVNNSDNDVTAYYVYTENYAGLTGTAPAHATTAGTLVIGGVYLVESPVGTCIGVLKVNGAGKITVS
jgi:hypothetical protein